MHKFGIYLKIIAIAIVSIIDTLKLLVRLTVFRGRNFHLAAKSWAKRLLWIIGVKLEIKGIQNIQKDESYIFAANHSSLLDIPILQTSIPYDFRIIYKKELEKVPIWGVGLRKSPYIGIVREDPRKAMESMEEAIRSIKDGTSVAIFPEGTRTKDGNLQEFKRGAFMLASKSGKPVIPTAIIGTRELLPGGNFEMKSGKAKIVFGEPIYMKIENRNDEKVLMEKVHSVLQEMLQQEKYQN